MRKLNQSLLALTGLLAMAGVSQAEELTANVGITSNYVFRGQTQSDDGIAIQGGVDWVHESNLYLGAWASNVDFPAPTNADGFEVDLYIGYTFDLGNDMAIDIGYINYQYTDSNLNDAEEVFFGFKFKQFSITYYDADIENNVNDYNYIDAKYKIELPNEVNLNLHYGQQNNDTGNDADDISIGINKEFQGLDVGLTFTSYDSNSSTDDDIVFVTITKTFGL